MSVPNLIPHKTLCISSYICTCLAFLFTLDFSNTILKLILQFHASWFSKGSYGNWGTKNLVI